MAITYSDPDVDAAATTIQIAALTPTDNAVIIGNGTAWTAESGATLRASLGLAIGSDVMAYDADLNDWAGVSPSNYLTTAAAAAAYQPLDSDLTAWAAVNPSSYSTTAQIAAAYQPLDSDLTSWAAVTRASGFDSFATSPSGANLATLLTSALPVSKGGTNATAAGITAFNNITGYSAAGATGTTSTNLVFSTSPTLVTPTLGVASATSINGLTITSTTGTLTITNGKTLSASNTLTFAGTDGSTLNVGAGGTLGSAAYVATGTSGATIPLLNGTNTWSGRQEIRVNGATVADTGADELVIGNENANGGLSILSGAANFGQVLFGRSGALSAGYVAYDHANSAILLGAGSATRVTIDSTSMRYGSDPVMTRGATETVTGEKTFTSQVAISSASVGLLLKNTATDYLHTIDKDNTGISFTCNSGSRSFRFLVGGSQEVEIIGGAKFGNPTGGFKGLGTINATAVYDDNTLLTCYIVEAWKYGQIDLAKWDAIAPNVEHPAQYEVVETGELDAEDEPITAKRLVAEAWTEVRQHAPARGFAKVAADRLDIDKFAQFVFDNERLPAFPAPDRWADMYAGKMATGDLIQRLWETVEVMAIHSIEARKRELALTARVAALEAAQ